MANLFKGKKGNILKIICALVIIAIELCIFFSGYTIGFNHGADRDTVKTEKNSGKKSSDKTSSSDTTDNQSDEDIVSDIISDMSISDMIYQMMFVTPESITNMGTVVQAGDTTKKALAKYPVGGIIYFAKNFESIDQTTEMISNTQKFSKIPLFIGVDEEGGRVARLGENPDMGTTKLPAMQIIGDSKDEKKAYSAGKTLANDLTKFGFNVDFAPDADILTNEGNTEIGDRSFGSDPEIVSLMVNNIVKGMEENGLSSTLKHFPGHGSTYLNSHSGYSESTRTLEELRSCEFLPFISGIEAGADFVMISHLTAVNATEEKVPSSVSKEIITDLLKNELGFKGIVITDSFSMGAVTDTYTPAQAAVKAVKAGVDMILMTPDLESAHNAILKAVETGDITPERIEESVRKIIELKVEKCIIK